jgi:hypothetical protein
LATIKRNFAVPVFRASRPNSVGNIVGDRMVLEGKNASNGNVDMISVFCQDTHLWQRKTTKNEMYRSSKSGGIWQDDP